MEVYNSSRTAAELEYALGAVPSIGENGNWWIGNHDTGVYALGAAVSFEHILTLTGDGESVEITETLDPDVLTDGVYYVTVRYGKKTDTSNQQMYVKIGGTGGVWGSGLRFMFHNGNTMLHYNYALVFIADGCVFTTTPYYSGAFTTSQSPAYETFIEPTVSFYTQNSTIMGTDSELKLYKIL